MRAPTAAEEVEQPGFDPIADLAAFPAGEEDEDQVDADGDEEEPEQVEVALFDPGRQVQAAPFGAAFSPFGGFFAAGRGGSLLTHEHGSRFDAGGRVPCDARTGVPAQRHKFALKAGEKPVCGG